MRGKRGRSSERIKRSKTSGGGLEGPTAKF